MTKVIGMILALAALLTGGVIGLAVLEVGPFGTLLAFAGLAPGEERNGPPAPTPMGTVPLEAIAVPLISGGKLGRQIFIIAELLIELEQRARVTGNLPRLQNAMIGDMMAFIPWHMTDRTAPETAAVSARMQAVADKVMGGGAVREVVVKVIYQR